LDHIRHVQIIDANDVGYSLDDFKKMIPKDFVFHAQKEKQIHQKTVRGIIDTLKHAPPAEPGAGAFSQSAFKMWKRLTQLRSTPFLYRNVSGRFGSSLPN